MSKPVYPESLSRWMDEVDEQLAVLGRVAQLKYSSLDDGSFSVYSGDSLRGIVGVQADGSVGAVAVNAPPSPTPTAPTLEPRIGGLDVTWDGSYEGGAVAPLDHTRIEVHLSATPGFLPDESTLIATIESPRGGTVTVPAAYEADSFVRLVARNTSGTASAASAQATAQARKIEGPDIQANSVTANELDVGSARAAILTAGIIDAGMLSADAITGKTITASTFRTDDTDRWLEMGPATTFQGQAINYPALMWMKPNQEAVSNFNAAIYSDDRYLILVPPIGAGGIRNTQVAISDEGIDLSSRGNMSITAQNGSVWLKSNSPLYLTAEEITGPTGDQLFYEMRANHVMTGGGLVSYDGVTLGWSKRFICISTGRGYTLAVDGYFDIDQPASGTKVYVAGTTTYVTATAAGIPVTGWDALWYELPYGSNSVSQPGNFHIVNYSKSGDFTVPNSWVLVGVCNGTEHSMRLGNGVLLNFTPRDTWHDVVFQNGWGNYGQGFVGGQYTKDDLGFVHLEGGIAGGTMNVSAFTLPSTHRPPGTMQLPSIGYNFIHLVLYILDTGEVRPEPGGAADNRFVNLTGTMFYVGW